MHSTPSLQSFPNVAFETVPMFVWLTMALSHPFKEDCLALFIVYMLHSAELTAPPPPTPHLINWHNLLAESAAAPTLESFLSCYV